MVAALYIFLVTVWVAAFLAVILFLAQRRDGRKVSKGELSYLERQRRTSLDRGERW